MIRTMAATGTGSHDRAVGDDVSLGLPPGFVVAALAGTGWPASAFDLEPVAARYRSVLGTFGPLAAAASRRPGIDVGDEAAFALRTMLVHELRRARLADPELPHEALPAGWPGTEAVAVASAVYHAVAEPAERWLAKVTGLVVDPAITARRLAR